MAKATNPPKRKMLKEVKITAKPIIHKRDTMVEVSSGRWPKVSAPKSKIDSVVSKSSSTVKDQAKSFFNTAVAKKQMNISRDTSQIKISNTSKTRNNSASDTMYGIAKALSRKPKQEVISASRKK